ncbi:MAG: DMT family protein [Candidatus Delongbacteria bacterium]|nr:DMT family protein [Candidatus Cloacimonadota bacterium]MCB9474599.1 DMT family protein [Candidatus Delongbacteria bacterium]
MLRIVSLTVVLLVISNAFMTVAWYGHLKHLRGSFWLWAALMSWGIALFEYLFQVPANRLGHQVLRIDQLKILQEVIALAVFVPVSIWVLDERPRLDYLWAGLCMLGAVYFIFRAR